MMIYKMLKCKVCKTSAFNVINEAGEILRCTACGINESFAHLDKKEK